MPRTAPVLAQDERKHWVPTFTTFALLTAGLIARPAGRTVCGMLAGRAWRGCGTTAVRTGSSRLRPGALMR